MELIELLDRARTRIGARSDRALCRALRIDGRSLIDYRRGNSLPTDDRMLRICDASGLSAEAGLLMLNMWRAQGDTRTTYRRIFKIWEATGAPLFNEARAETR